MKKKLFKSRFLLVDIKMDKKSQLWVILNLIAKNLKKIKIPL